MKLDIYLTPYIKFNFTQIKDLNVIPAAVKILEEHKGENFFILVLPNFLSMTSRAQVTEANIYKWDYITLKTFCTEK